MSLHEDISPDLHALRVSVGPMLQYGGVITLPLYDTVSWLSTLHLLGQEEAFLEAGNAVAKKAEAADGALPSDGHVCATQGRALGEADVANAGSVKVRACCKLLLLLT